MSLFAASRLAVVESRRPRLTTQVGPPSWNRNCQLLQLFVSFGMHEIHLVNQLLKNIWTWLLTSVVQFSASWGLFWSRFINLW
jgi:hypothetical protein